MIPTYVIYYILFLYLVSLKVSYDEEKDKSVISQFATESQEASINKRLTWENFKLVLHKSIYYCGILSIMYYFQYSCIGYLTENARTNMYKEDIGKYTFEII